MKPRHIAIILDGNRRFAKRLMMQPWKGHELGAKKVEQLLEWCNSQGVRELTLYCFSQENFSRTKAEYGQILGIFRNEFRRLKDDARLEKHGIRLRFIGRRELFPKDLQGLMGELEERTKNHDSFLINFAMGYSGKTEIVDAARKIAEEAGAGRIRPGQVNESLFKKNLYLDSEPDMIIRTGGEKRLSTFLLWQCAYSELFFLDKTWPEFGKRDFLRCIREFGERKRRFGK